MEGDALQFSLLGYKRKNCQGSNAFGSAIYQVPPSARQVWRARMRESAILFLSFSSSATNVQSYSYEKSDGRKVCLNVSDTPLLDTLNHFFDAVNLDRPLPPIYQLTEIDTTDPDAPATAPSANGGSVWVDAEWRPTTASPEFFIRIHSDPDCQHQITGADIKLMLGKSQSDVDGERARSIETLRWLADEHGVGRGSARSLSYKHRSGSVVCITRSSAVSPSEMYSEAYDAVTFNQTLPPDYRVAN